MSTDERQSPPRPQRPDEVRLAISGMTRASCPARIEGTLSRLDGIESATVDLATAKALVTYSAPLTVADIVAEVERTGYGARPLDRRPAAGALLEKLRAAEAARRSRTGAAPDPGTPGRALDGQPTASSAGHHDDARAPDGSHLDGSPTRAVLRPRLVLAMLLTAPVLALAVLAPGPTWSRWLQLVLAAPVVLWCAWPFHRLAAVDARRLAPTADSLVSLGVLTAWCYSLVAALAGGRALYADASAVVTTVLLGGRLLEARAREPGRQALTTLLHAGARDASVLRIDPTTRTTSEVRVPVARLAVGDQLIVRPGETIATDGVVLDGSSAVDASLVTGGSSPVDVGPGSEVAGGSVSTTGRIVVEARRVGADTMLARIHRLVEDARTGRTRGQRLADRVSAVLVPVVLGVAAATLVGWLLTGHDVGRSLGVAVTVLLIACPRALGLATPTALLVGTGRGAQLGTFVTGPEVLESTRRVDTVVLDKTGTVTTGELRLRSIAVRGRLSKKAALVAAAAVEQGSEHPVAQAIVAGARLARLDLPRIRDFEANPGEGATARIRDTEVTVGKAVLFEQVDPALVEHAATHAGTTVYVGWDGVAQAALTVEDTVRDTSPAAVARLQALGLTPYLLTGDSAANARSIAEQVGIDPAHVRAEVLPADKHEVVTALQREGRVVAMVGDGVDDAAALAQSDLGIAMGTGTDVATASADIVLARPDLSAAGDAIALSRATLRVVRQNLAWAFGYNVVAIPLAAFGLLDPMVAGAATALSSVLVVVSSLRLRRVPR